MEELNKNIDPIVLLDKFNQICVTVIYLNEQLKQYGLEVREIENKQPIFDVQKEIEELEGIKLSFISNGHAPTENDLKQICKSINDLIDYLINKAKRESQDDVK